MEDIENKYMMLINAYQGIEHLDDYILKAYVLEDLKEYIFEFKQNNNIEMDYKTAYSKLENCSLITKLQDALYVINELNGPIELVHIIEKKIKEHLNNS